MSITANGKYAVPLLAWKRVVHVPFLLWKSFKSRVSNLDGESAVTLVAGSFFLSLTAGSLLATLRTHVGGFSSGMALVVVAVICFFAAVACYASYFDSRRKAKATRDQIVQEMNETDSDQYEAIESAGDGAPSQGSSA